MGLFMPSNRLCLELTILSKFLELSCIDSSGYYDAIWFNIVHFNGISASVDSIGPGDPKYDIPEYWIRFSFSRIYWKFLKLFKCSFCLFTYVKSIFILIVFILGLRAILPSIIVTFDLSNRFFYVLKFVDAIYFLFFGEVELMRES